jgi:hypothetical protein
MTIEINKTLAIASIYGGDAGPGTGDQLGLSNTYNWLLPVSTLEPDLTKQPLVCSTFNLVMSLIAGNAQSSCSSTPLCGSGGYGTIQNPSWVQFSGLPPGSVSAGLGQLQAIGSQIDLSGANQADMGTNVNLLPVGSFSAAPVSGVTSWPLLITITQ